jgi:hypothetical protein
LRELVFERVEVEDLQHLGLVEGALDRAAADDGGEVERCAGDGGDGDAADTGDVGWDQGGGAVKVDAVVAASGPAGHDDVDARVVGSAESVEVCRGPVRERSRRPAG